MALFTLRGPIRPAGGQSQPASGGASAERPTFIQHLTGTGEYMKALGKARKGVTEEFFQQKHNFQKEKRLRVKDFEKTMKKQRESHFSRLGISDLAERPATKEELANSRIRYYVKENEKREQRMEENFERSEREAARSMTHDYHQKLRETAKQVRQQGTAAFKSQPKSTINPMDHFLGRGSSSSRPDTGRRGLSI